MRNGIRRLIRKKKTFQNCKKSSAPQHWTDCRRIRNILVTEIRNAKSDYIKYLSNKLISNKVPTREWCQIARYFMTAKANTTIPALSYNETNIYLMTKTNLMH